jgi:hypothetical protein
MGLEGRVIHRQLDHSPKLMTFDAQVAELESEPDHEEDCPPVLVELVRPKW